MTYSGPEDFDWSCDIPSAFSTTHEDLNELGYEGHDALFEYVLQLQMRIDELARRLN